MMGSEHEAYVVLVDDVQFKLDQVEKAFQQNNQTDVKCYPCNNKSNVQKELDEFLNNPVGCLVTPQKLFKGAECENAISLQHTDNAAHNMRGNLLRIVSKLVIVNGMDESDTFKMENVIIDNECLYCLQKCKLTMFKCLTCNTSTNPSTKNGGYVCNPCLAKCHPRHKDKGANVRDIKLDPNCDCNHII